MPTCTSSSRQSSVLKPLIVDLDGTLIRSDLLVESAFAYLGQNVLQIGSVLAALRRGKAALKNEMASAVDIDVSRLPYDKAVVSLIQEARSEGRQVFLASASNERYVAAVAEHLRLFDGWFASDDTENLSADAKARLLMTRFGRGGFDYVGNESGDLAVWKVANRSFAIRISPAVKSKLLAMDPEATILEGCSGSARAWIKLMRVHQWAKNALIFVPLVTAHRFDVLGLAQATVAFFCFSLAASAIYILNDLVDLDADRKHPSKKHRPLAAGTVPIWQAMMFAPVLLSIAIIGSFAVGLPFALSLLGYLLLTTAYSFALKRKMIIDIVVLALLYTIRVIAGGLAISVPISEWLLAFSMFIFISLALIKRYVELTSRIDEDLPDATNRNYQKADLNIVGSLAAAAGLNAVTVFSLYISSESVRLLYRHPQMLWLICPILIYWLGRALVMAHRRFMDDDPIVFALRDRNSHVAFGLIGLILLAAV
jgi:4-hydroxybenzoate polyprenyltransferase/phosphoserine phosphatase